MSSYSISSINPFYSVSFKFNSEKSVSLYPASIYLVAQFQDAGRVVPELLASSFKMNTFSKPVKSFCIILFAFRLTNSIHL